MPREYTKMRDKFIADGLSPAAAKTKAAKIYNSKHKRKNPWANEKRGYRQR